MDEQAQAQATEALRLVGVGAKPGNPMSTLHLAAAQVYATLTVAHCVNKLCDELCKVREELAKQGGKK